jgi:phage FluMu protein Com
MAIEFRCTGCNKLLRTQDDTAGKQAKCPQCGTVLQIPAAPAPPAPPGSMPAPPPGPALPTGGGGWADPTSWQAAPPQQAFGAGAGASPSWPSATGGPAYPGGANPYQSPTYGGYAMPPQQGVRNGPAWERLGPSPRSYIETLQECITDVPAFFATMRRDAGIGAPLGFALIGIILATMAHLAYQFLEIGFMNFFDKQNAGMQAADAGVTLVCVAIGFPLVSIAALFFMAAVFHLMLMMFDGANSGFEATFRAVTYTTGLTNLIQLVPCCGSQVGLLVWIVFTIIGLANIHDTTGWKASGAVLMPMFVCCCGFGTLFGFGIYAAMQQGMN